MDFAEACQAAFENKELLREFDRLYGTSFLRGQPIELAVDRATGKREEDLLKFVEFFREYIWDRLPDKCFV